jgi:hypothetical protein
VGLYSSHCCCSCMHLVQQVGLRCCAGDHHVQNLHCIRLKSSSHSTLHRHTNSSSNTRVGTNSFRACPTIAHEHTHIVKSQQAPLFISP